MSLKPVSSDVSRPECFARLGKVFPIHPDGLRRSPTECQDCPHKVACLKGALATPEGAAVDRGGVGSAAGLGRMIRGVRRWSALKATRRRKNMNKVEN